METSFKEIVGKANLKITKKRVAAYCRVSSAKEEQEYSYETQVNHYYNYITSNPSYELAGIFGDYARSGTNTRRRPEFKKMINMCELGLIDIIITKSISRFARKTTTTLETVNKLRDLGVVIYFEKEDIWTDDNRFDLFLTVYASFAQQEAVSISKNRNWQIEADMKNGKFKNTYLYGYKCYGDGRLEINEEQAVWVRYIFTRYASGGLIAEIINELEQKGVKSPIGKSRWNRTTIKEMLANEKYTGDALLHKTFTKKVGSRINTRNRGERDKFFVEEHHEPIITHELFDMAQNVKEERRIKLGIKKGVVNPPHPYAHYIYSLKHKEFLARKITHRGTAYETVSFQTTSKTDDFIFFHNSHLEMLFEDVISSLKEDKNLRADIMNHIQNRLISSNIEDKTSVLEEKRESLEYRKTSILGLPIDDEKKIELIAPIDGELTELNNKIAKYKSRIVMEFTTSSELDSKCKILKGDVDVTNPEQIKSLFELIYLNGREEITILFNVTNTAIDEKVLEQYPLLDSFMEGSFTFNKAKMKPVKTSWKLIVY